MWRNRAGRQMYHVRAVRWITTERADSPLGGSVIELGYRSGREVRLGASVAALGRGAPRRCVDVPRASIGQGAWSPAGLGRRANARATGATNVTSQGSKPSLGKSPEGHHGPPDAEAAVHPRG